ncbi:hypothetical protein MFU01_72380 [Myxococcus fulvus]|uniref:Lipoprotein n=2 Tax=Myxococcus fulvus TaxID=33 RepID=A0A511TDE7_MYXFU|nr:hypothetical protein [Myxococcus fulvus]GEN12201.1 hypothetical protein MFU01_72380 [Myxococcus fulvus]
MMRHVLVVAVFLGLSSLGCGGAVEDNAGDELAVSSDELSACSDSLPRCSSYEGRACGTLGASVQCCLSSTAPGVCICEPTSRLRWECFGQ